MVMSRGGHVCHMTRPTDAVPAAVSIAHCSGPGKTVQAAVATVAHEHVHTMPHLWSSPEMKTLCDIDYHNAIIEKNGHKVVPKYAHGIQITKDSAETAGSRIVHDPEVSIMGPDGPFPR